MTSSSPPRRRSRQAIGVEATRTYSSGVSVGGHAETVRPQPASGSVSQIGSQRVGVVDWTRGGVAISVSLLEVEQVLEGVELGTRPKLLVVDRSGFPLLEQGQEEDALTAAADRAPRLEHGLGSSDAWREPRASIHADAQPLNERSIIHANLTARERASSPLLAHQHCHDDHQKADSTHSVPNSWWSGNEPSCLDRMRWEGHSASRLLFHRKYRPIAILTLSAAPRTSSFTPRGRSPLAMSIALTAKIAMTSTALNTPVRRKAPGPQRLSASRLNVSSSSRSAC